MPESGEITSPGMAARFVQLGFALARLPLTVTEVVAAGSGLTVDDQPLVVAYEATEAQLKKVVGVLLRDRRIVDMAEAEERALRRRVAARWLADEADEVGRSAGARVPSVTDRGIGEEPAEVLFELEQAEERARQKVQEKMDQRAEAAARVVQTREKAEAVKEKSSDPSARAGDDEGVVTVIDERLGQHRPPRRHRPDQG